MAISQRDLEQLIARMGKENVLHSEADRLVYSTDIGSPPAVVDILLMGGRHADAVARCHSADDVETVVNFCLKRGIPMTPRAAATNALGGAVPKRGGVVIDLTPMNKQLEIDEGRSRCKVGAGMVIADLRAKLNEVGLDLPVYPTSALSATIGGFVAMDGHGIGSTANGRIGQHIASVEGIGPDGKPFFARDDDEIEFYVGLGGSTGIITSIEIDLVEASPDKPILAAMPSWKGVQALIEEATQRLPLKHAMFRGNDFFSLRCEATGTKKNPLGTRHAVLLVMSEKDHNAHAESVARMIARHGGDVLADKVATAEWAERMYPIKAKKLGPSLVAGEVFVPVKHIRRYLRRLEDRNPIDGLSVEGHVTDDGRVYFFIFVLDDERRPAYPLGWGASADILLSAKKLGGTSYQSGVWLQWESKDVFGANRYQKLKAFKTQGDHRNLMNPGTMFPLVAPVPEKMRWIENAAPVPIGPSLGFQLAAGNPVLQAAWGASFKQRRRKSLGVKAQDVAADMARGGGMGIHSDIIWGADLPSLQAIPNPGNLPMTQTPRGKIVLAKAFVQGKIVDPWDLKEALDIAEPEDAEAAVCWQWDDIKATLDAFRRTVTAEGVELDVKTVEIVEEVVEVSSGGAGGAPKLDIAAIKEQAANTPEPEKAWVLAADCIVCNGCEAACPTDAAIVTDIARVDRDLCIADGACFDACPTDAIRPGVEDESSSAGWPEGSRLAGKFGT